MTLSALTAPFVISAKSRFCGAPRLIRPETAALPRRTGGRMSPGGLGVDRGVSPVHRARSISSRSMTSESVVPRITRLSRRIETELGNLITGCEAMP